MVVDELVHGLHYDTDGNESGTTYHHDHLRSVTSLVESLGNAQATMEYGPFGELITETGNDNGNRLHYTGRELDDSGLYYYRARYYDPEVGRFLTEDPLGFEAGINFYTYVHNNPINANDPTGLTPNYPGGKPPTTASGWLEYAKQQGWTRSQSSAGPIEFKNQNGIKRLVIKQPSTSSKSFETF